MITEVKVVNTKVVKKLVDTDFYELRISVGNEYRAILFTIDHDNIVQAEQILLLNGFIKKSTKDNKKEIQKAQHILDTYYEKEDWYENNPETIHYWGYVSVVFHRVCPE